MNILNDAINSSQKVLTGIKNYISKPIRAAKLKNLLNAKEKIQRVLFSNENDDENLPPRKHEGSILPSSKKIQKMAYKPNKLGVSRRALEDITNIERNNTSTKSPDSKFVIEKDFLEDEVKQTSNYITLKYMNPDTRNAFKFYCFHDRELEILPEYASKTIAHSCDNDCMTDEDQIRGAIKNLYKSIETELKVQNQTDSSSKQP